MTFYWPGRNTKINPKVKRTNPKINPHPGQKSSKRPSFFDIDHADPRRGSRAHRNSQKKKHNFRTSTTPISAQFSHLDHSDCKIAVHFISLCALSMHASMHFTVYFPCACLYTLHCLLSLRMSLCIFLSSSRTCLYAFHCTFPVHASMHFTLYLPYACLCAFHCAFPMQLSCACRTQRLYRKNPSQCFREERHM